jgi:hypothetical protein
VDECAHEIVYLEHANEQQDLEIEKWAAVMASLEQQIQVLQLQAARAPTSPAEPDAVSNVNEE